MEVGKKYKTNYNLNSNSVVYECILITPGGNALLKKSSGGEKLLSPNFFKNYIEYKEPRKMTILMLQDKLFEKTVYPGISPYGSMTKIGDEDVNYKVIDVIEWMEKV